MKIRIESYTDYSESELRDQYGEVLSKYDLHISKFNKVNNLHGSELIGAAIEVNDLESLFELDRKLREYSEDQDIIYFGLVLNYDSYGRYLEIKNSYD